MKDKIKEKRKKNAYKKRKEGLSSAILPAPIKVRVARLTISTDTRDRQSKPVCIYASVHGRARVVNFKCSKKKNASRSRSPNII